jgi:hypothetical protein
MYDHLLLSEKSVIFVWNAVHWGLYVYILYPSGKVSLKTSVHLKLPDIDADMVLVGNVCLITWIAIRKKLTFDIVNYKKIFVGGLISYWCYLWWLFAYSGIQRIMCCVFFLVFFGLCLVYQMLPVSLDYPFLIASSVFSNVYFVFDDANIY